MSKREIDLSVALICRDCDKVWGQQSMKFGSEMPYREDNRFKSNDQTGQFVFDNTYTRPTSASSQTPTVCRPSLPSCLDIRRPSTSFVALTIPVFQDTGILCSG